MKPTHTFQRISNTLARTSLSACIAAAYMAVSTAASLTVGVTATLTTSTASATDYIVATVDETPILHSELQASVNEATAALKKTKGTLPSQKTLEAKILDRLITRTTQLNLIKRLGSRISNQAINESLHNIAAKRGISSLSELQITLEQNQPGSYAELRRKIREEMTIQQLRQQELKKRVNITDQDIDYFLLSPESDKLHKTEYRTNHIRISVPENTASKAQRTEALRIGFQIKQAFDAGEDAEQIVKRMRSITNLPIQGGDMGYHSKQSLPEQLRQQILLLKSGETTQPVARQDGIHIINLADKKDASENIIHQWKVSHILIKPTEIKSLSQAKQNIDELYEQLRQDANFATLASTYSDDPGSARKGGSLDWVSTGQMVPEFDAMMQRTTAGDFSIPFQTQYGWHILKVEAERDKNMSETFKRNVARETLFKRMSSQAIEDWMQELRANSHIRILDPRFK